MGGHSLNFRGGTDTLPESSKDVREVCAPQKPTGLEAKLLATYPNLDMMFWWEALWSDVFWVGIGWLDWLGLTQGGLTCLKLTRAYVFSNDDEKYDNLYINVFHCMFLFFRLLGGLRELFIFVGFFCSFSKLVSGCLFLFQLFNHIQLYEVLPNDDVLLFSGYLLSFFLSEKEKTKYVP